MGRSKGSNNKDKLIPLLLLREDERIQLFADLIIDIILEEDRGSPADEELCKAT